MGASAKRSIGPASGGNSPLNAALLRVQERRQAQGMTGEGPVAAYGGPVSRAPMSMAEKMANARAASGQRSASNAVSGGISAPPNAIARNPMMNGSMGGQRRGK